MANSRHKEKMDMMTVVLHWGLVITLIFSLTTGLRITADSEPASWARALNFLLLQGDVVRWHVWAAFALFLVAVGYFVFLGRARLRTRVILDSVRIINLTAPDRSTRWKAINVILYWFAFILLGIAALTGTVLYFAPGLISYHAVTWLHELIAWGIIVYALLHILAQLALGGLRQLLVILRPRAAYGPAALVTLLIAGLIGVFVYTLNQTVIRELNVAKIEQPPIIDGNGLDVAWHSAEPVDIVTTRGNNGETVTVSVRMLHDSEHLYALFEWPDSTRSQKHLPLQKTASGWRIVQKEYDKRDEDDYFEDKFAVMLASTSKLAGAGTAHLGPKPLATKPGPLSGRGLHYTTDGSIVDIWHWQSVRTGPLGQADDNYFGSPAEPDFLRTRYTGGYLKDPDNGDESGAKANWDHFNANKIRPLRLPKDPALLERLGELNLDPEASDDGQFWLAMNQTIAYSKELDDYPVGTVMPSVLIDGALSGDRGDLTATAEWHNGWWQLELKRKLDTGSDYDIPLRKDEPVYLWVAVFDHTETRHSRHLHPLRVVLQ